MYGKDHSFRGDSRGQLILVGGVLIATVLVLLVLVLNGVLYTENIATRGQPQSIDRGVDTTSVVKGATSELIQLENLERYETDEQASTNVRSDIDNLGELLNERQFEAHGELTGTEVKNIQEAWVVVQEENNEFTSSGTSVGTHLDDWDVAEANGIRNATMTVTSASTYNPSEEDGAESVFRMDVTGSSGEEWTIWIFDHPTQNRIGVTNATDSDGNPDLSNACFSDGGPAEIDFGEMTVDGNQCGFSFAEGTGSGLYEIEFARGDTTTGTYQFVFGEGNGAVLGGSLTSEYVRDTTDGDSPDPHQPTAYDGVYSATTVLNIDGESVDVEAYTYAAPQQPEETHSSEAP